MRYRIRKHSDRLSQILLSPPIDGFDDFISVWVYRGQESFIVETGPSSTAGALLAALKEIGLASPDYILLTHIHIDHAGGIGEIAAAFPGTPVVCHDIGRPHLIDPEKLWQGTVKTLGDTGRAYGPIKPVPEDRL
jgi:glyoxylase-like metal-dependent hydrolase (beta-lactamase superfamily II)